MLKSILFVSAFLTPSVALAANVTIPVICQIDSNDDLDCNLSHASATETNPGEWVVAVPSGDTVYFEVSDFTQNSEFHSMTAETVFALSSTPWSKSGSTATSPGETPEASLEYAFQETSVGKPARPKMKTFIRVEPTGG